MLGGMRGARSGNEEPGDPSTERQRKQQMAAYQGAVEAVFAIVIAVGLGYLADEHFETTPRYILVGVALGLGAFILRVVRMRPEDTEPTDPPGQAQQTGAAEQQRTMNSTEPNTSGAEHDEGRDGKRQ
jgi:F0F1-type ATP synthase assembly protein I